MSARNLITVPNLDKTFVAERNVDDNWIVGKINENIDLLNYLAANLPPKLPWRCKTAEEFKAEAALIVGTDSEFESLRFWWRDMLNQNQAYGLLTALRLIEIVSSSVW